MAWLWEQREEFDRLETVYVSVHNMGDEFFHHMGSVRGMATRGSSYYFFGEKRASLGVFLSLWKMR